MKCKSWNQRERDLARDSLRGWASGFEVFGHRANTPRLCRAESSGHAANAKRTRQPGRAIVAVCVAVSSACQWVLPFLLRH